MKEKNKSKPLCLMGIPAHRILLFLLFSVLLMSFLCPSVFGAEDTRSANLALCKTRSEELERQLEAYQSMDSSEDGQFAQSVTQVVNTYRKQLLDLQSHTDVATRSLEKEIELAYLRGTVAGKLRWIYVTNAAVSVNEQESLVFLASYEELIARLDSMEELTEEAADTLVRELNVAIYAQRIQSLSASDDSLTTHSIVAGAVEDVEKLGSAELSGESYRAILEQARADVALQRHRDALYENFCKFYSLLDPAAEPQKDKISALLMHHLSTYSQLSDMNGALKQSVDSLLERYATETHKTRFISKLKDKIALEISAAKSGNRRADITPYALNFEHLYAIADAKDSVEALIRESEAAPSAVLSALAAEYTATGGYLDKCATASALEFELWRATLRIEWFEEVCAAKQSITERLDPYDPSTLCGKADSEWSAVDARICAVMGSNTTACTDAVSNGKAALASLLITAEADAFRLDHISIIEKPQSSLRAEDKTALISAIEEWESLSSEAKALLKSETDKLISHYRSVTGLLIMSTVSADKAESIRKASADRLCKELNALAASDPVTMRKGADALLLRAEYVTRLLDRYHEILSKTDYPSYDEKYKEECKKAVEAGCLSMESLSVPAETLASELEAILTRSLLVLTKSDALARISLAAEQSTLAEVTSAVRIAEAKINAATAEEAVLTLASDCILTVRRVLLAEDAEELKAAMEQALREMSYLTDTQISSLTDRLRERLTAAKTAISAAGDLGTLELAFTTYSLECEGILRDAESANLATCREEGRAMLEELIRLAKEELEALKEPDASIKLQFRTDLEALLTEYHAKINLAPSTDAVASLLAEAEAQAKKLIQDARLYKIRLLRAELIAGLRQTFAAEHYSDSSYQRVTDVILQFEQELEVRETSEEYERLLKLAEQQLSLVPTLLEEAKEDAALRLQAEYDRLMLSATSYSSAARERLKSILDGALSAAEAVSDIAKHQTVTDIANTALIALRDVKRDLLVNGPTSLTGSKYPQDFSHTNDGYWGIIRLPDSIPSGSTLTVFEADLSNDDFYNKISGAIQADKLSASDGSALSSSLEKKLKKSELLLGLSIHAGLPASSSAYRVEVLLPGEMADTELLGILWFGEDGTAEFYNCSRSGSVLSFETSHFSDFYIVTESTINLVPIIVLIACLILCELIILVLLLYRRAQRDKEGGRIPSDDTPSLPFSASAFLPLGGLSLPKMLRMVKPQNGGGLLILLSGAAVLLGVGIAILAKEDPLFRRKKSKKAKEQRKEQLLLPTSRRHALPARREEGAITKDSAEMISNTEALRQSAAGSIALAEEQTENGDLYANAFQGRSIDENKPAAEAPSDAYDHGEFDERWYELNLDVLTRHFEAGDCITPELLKKMGLIPESVTHLKILARGHLSIPLFISAQGFSSSALRAIKKAGGRAHKIR